MTETIEELERQLAAATDDQEQVRLLNEVAFRVRGVDPQRAVALSERAHALATSVEDNAGLAAALLGLAFGKMIRGNYSECLALSLDALARFRDLGDDVGTAQAGVYLGFVYRSLGNLDRALEHYLEAHAILSQPLPGQEKERKEGLAWCIYGLAGVQSELHDQDQALQHYEECLLLFEELDVVAGKSRALSGIGSVLMARGQYDQALEKLRCSLDLNKETKVVAGLSRSLTDVGDCLEAMGNINEALDYNRTALALREESDFRDAALTNRINIGRILLQQGLVAEAGDMLDRARTVAEDLEVKPKLFRIHEILAEAHEKSGRFDLALEHFQTFHRLEREVHSDETKTRVKNLQVASKVDIAEKEAEIHRLRNVELARLNEELQERNEAIRREQEYNEELLHNVLPAKIVRELRQSGTTNPETFEDVTVFFSDFIDFTKKSATLEPAKLIAELNEIFTKFDEITERLGCERIKTIGDAYLAVCGMPRPDKDHAAKVLRLAQEAVEYLNERNQTSDIEWPVRIGVHSGRVVGGVVGVKKYIYDVFGDTINTASRIESYSESMRINVSQSTYELTKGHFTFVPRNEIEVKGKGAVKMYFLAPA